MDTKTMINQLKYEAEKHKNDSLFTGQTNITALCSDVIPKLEKLAEYETAEEDGRLVILPCKIGTIVYAIRQSWYGYVIDKKRFSYEMIGKVGRSVFFTCEEAEKALEERNDT